jgi:hypothetical protein
MKDDNALRSEVTVVRLEFTSRESGTTRQPNAEYADSVVHGSTDQIRFILVRGRDSTAAAKMARFRSYSRQCCIR